MFLHPHTDDILAVYTRPRPRCATLKLLPEKLIERLVRLRIGASGLIEIGDSLEGMKNQADQYEAEEKATRCRTYDHDILKP